MSLPANRDKAVRSAVASVQLWGGRTASTEALRFLQSWAREDLTMTNVVEQLCVLHSPHDHSHSERQDCE